MSSSWSASFLGQITETEAAEKCFRVDERRTLELDTLQRPAFEEGFGTDAFHCVRYAHFLCFGFGEASASDLRHREDAVSAADPGRYLNFAAAVAANQPDTFSADFEQHSVGIV